MKDLLKFIPQVEKVLQRQEWKELSEELTRYHALSCCRKALDKAKKIILQKPDKFLNKNEIEALINSLLKKQLLIARLTPLRQVINATGIILHTNLGRARLDSETAEEVYHLITKNMNLEIDLYSGKRGVRGDYVKQLAARLCNAEKAIIVNNNAAAVLCTLSALAANREVLVSRGELVQIGGGFRIPEVIQQGGAILKEVGTTNITTIKDYKENLGEKSGALLQVHKSNFSLIGFTKSPSIKELSFLKRKNLPLIVDLGSGILINHPYCNNCVTPALAIKQGADIVCFSGDKLLGGIQAGIIVGKEEYLKKIAKLPLLRAVRPGKFVYAVLQKVFSLYEKKEYFKLSPWRELNRSTKQILEIIKNFKKELKLDNLEIVKTWGEFGAGSAPDKKIPSYALVVANGTRAIELEQKLRHGNPPVIAYIKNNQLLINFLTILPEDQPLLKLRIKELLG